MFDSYDGVPQMLTAFEHGWLTSSKTTFDALDDEQPAFRIKVNVRTILFALRCKVKRITFDDDDILSWMSRCGFFTVALFGVYVVL